ncbi:UDP-N-acetylmuramate--L-alanine ligase [hydrothermal vent metagenome]|uniref:UDP-N-acetylmuramate--L-alanine ligase n=1 Tax=hydrothermal vent metagenome TaxID=652676 RepID=A0A3B1DJ57_9ZZZZ
MNKHYHFIGIGGIGMGAVASLLLAKGYKVSGSDMRRNQMTEDLHMRGAEVFCGHDAQNIGQADIVVVSSAISKDNVEIVSAEQRAIPIIPRAKLLAFLMKDYIGVTVAGAHGKTTTSSMIVQLLTKANLYPTSAVGGVLQQSMGNAQLGHGQYFVAEVDESDGSFLYFKPSYSVITNIDFEHIDYYKNWDNILKAYRQFIQQTQPDGQLIVYGDDTRLKVLMKKSAHKFMTYGFLADNDICAKNIIADGFYTYFDCIVYGQLKARIELRVPGRHNVANALACISIGLSLGIDINIIKDSLKTYQGVRRRFQVKSMYKDVWIVDDYAHHPTEIKSVIQTAKEFERNRLIVVFQPHRYSRMQALWKEFIRSFAGADYVIITDIYAASEDPINGVTSVQLAEEIQALTDKPVFYVRKKVLMEHLEKVMHSGDMVLFLGAGDITKISEMVKVKEDSSLLRVGVLMGGYSSERAISLKSGEAVCRALKQRGYEVVPLDIKERDEGQILKQIESANIDTAFIALHGQFGEDGKIQVLLEQAKILYTGSDVEASQIAINKVATKEILQSKKIVSPRWYVVSSCEDIDFDQLYENVGQSPYIVKPVTEGSSIGLVIVQRKEDLPAAFKSVWQYGTEAMCEEYISGRELTVGIIGRTALPVVEISPVEGVFDFTAKYQKGMTNYTVPAAIPTDITIVLQEIALKVHQSVGCRDFSRVDFILSEEGIPYVLEINTIPGFTATSLLPMAARAAGIDFPELCEKIIEMQRKQSKQIKGTFINI